MYFNFSISYSRSYALLLVGCQISLYGPTRSWPCPSSFCGWWYQDWKSWWQIYQDVNKIWELYLMKSNISNLDYLLLKNCQTRKWHEFNKWLLWWHILLIWLHLCFNKKNFIKKFYFVIAIINNGSRSTIMANGYSKSRLMVIKFSLVCWNLVQQFQQFLTFQ